MTNSSTRHRSGRRHAFTGGVAGLLVAALCSAALPAAAADQYFLQGGVQYQYDDTDAGIGASVYALALAYPQAIVIPASIDTAHGARTVRSIEGSVFASANITSVSLPSSLESIGPLAFLGTQLTELDIPGSVHTVGNMAFYGTPTLTRISFEEGLQYVDDSAFMLSSYPSDAGHSGTLQFPDSLVTIGAHAFQNRKVTSVRFGSGLRTIGESAFGYTADLRSIHVPEGVETILPSAFVHSGLRDQVVLPSTVTGIGTSAFATAHSKTLVLLGPAPNVVDATGTAVVGAGDHLAFGGPATVAAVLVRPEHAASYGGSFNGYPAQVGRAITIASSLAGQLPEVYYVADGSVPTLPVPSGTSNWALQGFYEDAAFTTPYVPAAIGADITLYAKWVPASSSAKPSITGTRRVGETLTAIAGSWPLGTTFTYQWLRNDKTIPGATGHTYGLVAADAGKRISVRVQGTLPSTQVQTRTSAKTGSIAKGVLTAGVPTIAGSPYVGEPVSAVVGAWPTGTTFKYQWYANGKAIKRATKATLTVPGSAVNTRLSVRVTGALPGYVSAHRIALAPSVVEPGVIDPPTDPIVTGTVQTGSKLGVATPGWPGGFSRIYQWYRNGEPVYGATKSTFTVPTAAQGDRFHVEVVLAKTGYATKWMESANSARALKAGTVTLSGTARVGQELTATTSGWKPGVTFTYQWYRSSKSTGASWSSIAGATGPTYTLVGADKNKYVSVKVTATDTGYGTAVAWAKKRTAKVK